MSAQQAETFGQRLSRLLRESDRSQRWLVKQAKLSSSVVSRLVRGNRRPTLEPMLSSGSVPVNMNETETMGV